MKVIDLLNKMANDEVGEIEFKYRGDIVKYDKSAKRLRVDESVSYWCFDLAELNGEIEIIEEKKEAKPVEYLKKFNFKEFMSMDSYGRFTKTMDEYIKINELVDKVNELEREMKD